MLLLTMDSIVEKQPVSKQRTAQGKIHPLEPWRDVPYTCIHCGKVLRNYAAKNVHLQHCKKRILARYYKVGDVLFILHWNPLKKRSNAMHDLITRFHNQQMVVGALELCMRLGILHRYSATKLDGSPDMIEHPDGWVQYPVIKQKMSKTTMSDFECEVKRLESEKLKSVENPLSSETEFEKSV